MWSKKWCLGISVAVVAFSLVGCAQQNAGGGSNGKQSSMDVSDGELLGVVGPDSDFDGDGIINGEDTDIDGDGLSNILEDSFGTNKYCADTDGDGWTDQEEAIDLYEPSSNSFNPCIADVPKLSVKITGKPKFYYLKDESTSTETSLEVSSTAESSTSTTVGNSTEKSSTLENGWGISVKEGYSWAKDGGFSFESEQSYNGSYSSEDSYTYSTEQEKQYTQSLGTTKSTATSQGVNITGGKVIVPLKFTNPTNTAYTISGVSVALYTYDSSNKELVSSCCQLECSGFSGATLQPKSSSGEFA